MDKVIFINFGKCTLIEIWAADRTKWNQLVR